MCDPDLSTNMHNNRCAPAGRHNACQDAGDAQVLGWRALHCGDLLIHARLVLSHSVQADPQVSRMLGFHQLLLTMERLWNLSHSVQADSQVSRIRVAQPSSTVSG